MQRQASNEQDAQIQKRSLKEKSRSDAKLLPSAGFKKGGDLLTMDNIKEDEENEEEKEE